MKRTREDYSKKGRKVQGEEENGGEKRTGVEEVKKRMGEEMEE